MKEQLNSINMQKEILDKLKNTKWPQPFIKEIQSSNGLKEFVSKNINYTDIAKSLSWKEAFARVISQKPPMRQSDLTKNLFVSYNGMCITSESVEKGIEVLPIQEGIEKYPALIEKVVSSRRQSKNTDLKDIYTRNAFSNGVFVYVHDKAFQDKNNPVKVTLYSSIGDEGFVDVSYYLVIIGKDNNVIVHDESLPVDFEEISIASNLVENFVDTGAMLKYQSLQNGSQNLYILSSKDFYLAKNTRVEFIDLLLNGKSITQKVNAYLEGEDCEFIQSGISLPSKKQVFENYSIINNIAQSTIGRVLFKNVLLGESKNFFDGLIKVEKGADKTNSYLEDHTILVSENAKSESIPGLEIEADDVKASHGATIGTIDKDILFYGMSRGLDEVESIKLITSGFIKPVLDQLPDADLRNRILSLYMEKINQIGNE